MWNATKQIFSLIRPYWGKLIAIVFLMLFQLAFALIFPLGLQMIFDNAIPNEDIRYLLWVLGGLVAGFFISAFSSLGQDYLTAQIGANSLKSLRIRMFDHLHSQSAGFYYRHETGDLMSRFSSDLNSIENAITNGLPPGLYNVLLIVSTGILLFFIEWHLALAVLAAIPLVMVGPELFGSRAVDASYQRKLDESGLSGIVQENVSGQAVIKAFGLKKIMRSSFAARASKLVGNTVRMNFFSALVGRTANSSMYLVIIITTGVGAYLVVCGFLTTGAMLAFIALLLNLDEGTDALSKVSPIVIQSVGGLQHIAEILDEKPEIVDPPDAISLPPFSDQICFHGVTFSYTGDKPHLDNVSLCIGSGESVAFVGSSGSGKSTVFNLITGSYHPDEGSITFDGLDIDRIKQESIHAQMGIVFQDSFLFNTSIMENIRYGRPSAEDADVVEAARTAEIHDFIMELPEQYDTMAGQGGDRLSGGQRQRVAIARALLRNPPILVMDEATSALDPVTEAEINRTLKKLARKHTIISITHRLDPVVHMDRIYVMDRGNVIEEGIHEDLLALEGTYYSLWNKQSGFRFKEEDEVYEIDARRLRDIPFLQNLDEKFLQGMSHRFTTESFETGEMILNQGEAGKRFYIIARGSVNISRISDAGTPQQLAVLEVGDYFGEISLITHASVTASVEARTPTTCLVLSRQHFNRLLKEAPELKSAMMPVMEKRLRELSSKSLL